MLAHIAFNVAHIEKAQHAFVSGFEDGHRFADPCLKCLSAFGSAVVDFFDAFARGFFSACHVAVFLKLCEGRVDGANRCVVKHRCGLLHRLFEVIKARVLIGEEPQYDHVLHMCPSAV